MVENMGNFYAALSNLAQEVRNLLDNPLVP